MLANESQNIYDNLLASYRKILNPVGQIEYDLAVQMVNARWRLRRIWAIETAMLDAEMFMLQPSFEASFSITTPALRQADAVQALAAANPQSVQIIERAETRLTRIFDRSLNSLIKLQKLRLGKAPAFDFNAETIEPDETQVNYEETEIFSWFSLYTKVPIFPTPVRPGPVYPPGPPPDQKAA